MDFLEEFSLLPLCSWIHVCCAARQLSPLLPSPPCSENDSLIGSTHYKNTWPFGSIVSTYRENQSLLLGRLIVALQCTDYHKNRSFWYRAYHICQPAVKRNSDHDEIKLSTMTKQACFAGCAQTLPDVTPLTGKIHPFSKIAVREFGCSLGLRIF